MSNQLTMATALLAMTTLTSAAHASSYFGLSAGMSSLDVSKSDFDDVLQGMPATSSLDDGSFAWSAQIGYRWGKYIAAELGYIDLGEANYRADIASLDESYTLRLTSSGDLPQFKGEPVNAGGVSVAPVSITYLVIANAGNANCQ